MHTQQYTYKKNAFLTVMFLHFVLHYETIKYIHLILFISILILIDRLIDREREREGEIERERGERERERERERIEKQSGPK